MEMITEKFGEVQELKYGKSLKASDRKPGEFPVYGSNGIIGYHNTPLVNNSGIVLGRKGSFGKVHFVKGPFWPIDTTYYIEFNGMFNLKYLYYLLESMKLDRVNLHVAVPGLSRKDVYKRLISYPKSLTDQKRIAKVLSDCEQLIAWRKESIALLDEYLKSVFLEMFGDPLTNSKQSVEKLGDHIEFLTSGSRGWAKYYSDSGSVFLRIQNVKEGLIDLNDVQHVTLPDSKEGKRTRVRKGDLVMSITADLGRTGVIEENISEGYINQHLALIRLNDRLNSTYVAFYFFMPFGNSKVQRKNREGVKSGLNFDDIRSFDVIVPAIERQLEFEKIFREIQVLKKDLNSSLQHLQTLYASLSQKAFNGQLDLSKVILDEAEMPLTPTEN